MLHYFNDEQCLIRNIGDILGLLQIKLLACNKRCQDEELEQLYSTNAEEVKHISCSAFLINVLILKNNILHEH